MESVLKMHVKVQHIRLWLRIFNGILLGNYMFSNASNHDSVSGKDQCFSRCGPKNNCLCENSLPWDKELVPECKLVPLNLFMQYKYVYIEIVEQDFLSEERDALAL